MLLLVPAAVAWWFAYLVLLHPDANSLVEWSGDPFAPAASVIGDRLDFVLATVPILVPVLVGYVWRLRADRAEDDLAREIASHLDLSPRSTRAGA